MWSLVYGNNFLLAIWFIDKWYCRSWSEIEKIPGVIKGRFYVSTFLSDSWEALAPPHVGVTLGRFLH